MKSKNWPCLLKMGMTNNVRFLKRHCWCITACLPLHNDKFDSMEPQYNSTNAENNTKKKITIY